WVKNAKEFDLQDYEGLIKCEIIPSTVLLHPVLPLKMNNKLMFVLCRTCGEEMNTGGVTVQYDGVNDDTGLFTKMMNNFVKVKTEASRWPLYCKTDEDKKQYIVLFKEREGVELEYDKIEITRGNVRYRRKLFRKSSHKRCNRGLRYCTSPPEIIYIAIWKFSKKEYCITIQTALYMLQNLDINIKTGEFLGDMTDELLEYGKGCYITEFCSGGS
ncbi:hypothetical protein NQ318_007524, partial [Aromia moschata]